MFYLQTKDGESFFTSSGSNDRCEFEKIIEAKMGHDAAVMFSEFIKDAREEGEESAVAPVAWDEIDAQTRSLRNITAKLWLGLSEDPINKDQFQNYLQKLDSVAYHLENL